MRTAPTMRPLFPRWADTILRLVIAGAAVAAVGVPTLVLAWARTPHATGERQPLIQPVKFDHRHHVRDDGIDCLYCHTEATRSPYAASVSIRWRMR